MMKKLAKNMIYTLVCMICFILLSFMGTIVASGFYMGYENMRIMQSAADMDHEQSHSKNPGRKPGGVPDLQPDAMPWEGDEFSK